MKCIIENCNTQPIFNYENKKIGLYCNVHKLDNMINVKNKKCLYNNCKTRPCFNYENKKIGLYCNVHKLDNMIDITHKKCLYNNCKTRPCFNYETEKKGLYCNLHKLDNMINVKDKKCLYEHCNKQPCFNYENKKVGLYCNLHKLNNMVNVKDKKCIYNNCQIRPTYNFSNEKQGIYCKKHSLKNMIDVISNRCFYDNCNTRPTFNYTIEKKALYCKVHIIDDKMTNIIDKKCTICSIFQVGKRNNYLCSYCNPTKSKRIKTKELSIKSLLETNNIKFIHDKQITNECCLKYRPDFLIDCNTYYIVLEVDEDAHCSYDKECEIIRMNNIITSIGLPAKFVRYNPDKKKISKKVKEETLIKTLKEEMDKELLEDISPIYLFY